MKAHHRVEVIRIKEVKPHTNADKLEIVPIEGYQAVVGKGQYKVGDLAYYIPPDSVVPVRPEFEFLWKGPLEGEVPVKRRRITAKRLRGEWSEGLLMPAPDGFVEGKDVAEALGITHYDAPEDEEPTKSTGIRRRKIPTTWRGWVNFIKMWIRGERREGGPVGLPTYDVEAMKKYMNVFQEGEQVIVTEKIHGSNARYSYVKGFFGYGHMYAGSRNLWKSIDSTCAWRRALKDNPWIEVWCKAHPGYALYGEITPTQKGYDYGSGDKVQFFLFDVRLPNGNWADDQDPVFTGSNVPGVPSESPSSYAALLQINSVPRLYQGPFSLETIKSFVDGPSEIEGAKHIREGVVVKAEPNRYAHNLGRAQLKIVSNNFLERETK
jgi:tRNA-binding EMAP/Myf-like protein